MQHAEHDPLHFGAHDAALAPSQQDELGAGYGVEPLADQATGWEHYPPPPLPPAALPAPSAPPPPINVSAPPAPQQQPQQQPQHHYPAIPAPAEAPLPQLQAAAASASSGAPPPVALPPPSPSSPGGNPELRIHVHSPQRLLGPSGVPGVGQAFMTYELSTTTSLPGFSSNSLSVRRRFKDVVSLSKLLANLLPGAVLPARPDKNFVEGRLMSSGFVEERRAALERYLNRLAAHPLVARSEALHVFLEAPGSLKAHPAWLALKPPAPSAAQATVRLVKTLLGAQGPAPSPAEVVRPAAASRDVYRLVHERMGQLRGNFKDAPVTQEEAALREAGVLLQELRSLLTVADARANTWLGCMDAVSQSVADVGASFDSLAHFQDSYGMSTEARALRCIAQGCTAAKPLAVAAASATASSLTPLHDYRQSMRNVLGALASRQAQLLTSQTLAADRAERQARLAQLTAAPTNQFKRMESLRREVAQMEATCAAAEAEYSRRLVRNREEVAAFRAATGEEMLAMVRILAEAQRAHAVRAQQLWSHVAAALPVTG